MEILNGIIGDFIFLIKLAGFSTNCIYLKFDRFNWPDILTPLKVKENIVAKINNNFYFLLYKSIYF